MALFRSYECKFILSPILACNGCGTLEICNGRVTNTRFSLLDKEINGSKMCSPDFCLLCMYQTHSHLFVHCLVVWNSWVVGTFVWVSCLVRFECALVVLKIFCRSVIGFCEFGWRRDAKVLSKLFFSYKIKFLSLCVGYNLWDLWSEWNHMTFREQQLPLPLLRDRFSFLPCWDFLLWGLFHSLSTSDLHGHKDPLF